jgi:predicted O-methyltransferase YrrM
MYFNFLVFWRIIKDVLLKKFFQEITVKLRKVKNKKILKKKCTIRSPMALNRIQKAKGKVREGIGLVKKQGMVKFTKEVCLYCFWESIGHRVGLPLAIKRFKARAEKIKNIDDAIDFAFSFNYTGLSIRPGQFKNEISQLLKVVENLNAKRVMEIGTAKGGTLFLFCQVANPTAKMISVDLPGGKFGGGYSNSKNRLYKAFAEDNQEITLIRKNTHEMETLDEVKRVLNKQNLDFLFIDGDHTYKGVKEDFEMYSPLVRKGGVIAFHDITKHPSKTECKVNEFWDEIKKNYKFNEFVDNWQQGTYGIGVLYV